MKLGGIIVTIINSSSTNGYIIGDKITTYDLSNLTLVKGTAVFKLNLLIHCIIHIQTITIFLVYPICKVYIHST